MIHYGVTKTGQVVVARGTLYEIAELSGIIRETGAVEDVEKRIDELTESGLAHVRGAALSPEAVETLETLAVNATARRM